MAKKIKTPGRAPALSQLIIPLVALALLVVFNLIRDPGFFSINFNRNNLGNLVLAGNLISIFNGASELAVLAMGMTLVTAACGGQDISVGAAAAIAGSVYMRTLRSAELIDLPVIATAFFASCLVAIIIGAFNGTLVAVFKIQPMIATLIVFTIGRAIAYWINGGASPAVDNDLVGYFGGFFPGVPVPTPVFAVVLFGVILGLVLKLTNLGLYTQAVGVNENSARLNGINPVFIKILAFAVLGVAVAVAGCMNVSRMGIMNNEGLLLNIEMDAILAVAIGGNALSGGKFNVAGSILGAYIIQGLTTTLTAMRVASTDVKAYKAVAIIILVVLASPVVKEKAALLRRGISPKKETPAATGGA